MPSIFILQLTAQSSLPFKKTFMASLRNDQHIYLNKTFLTLFMLLRTVTFRISSREVLVLWKTLERRALVRCLVWDYLQFRQLQSVPLYVVQHLQNHVRYVTTKVVKYIQFLWVLLFLNTYAAEAVCTALTKVDKKNFSNVGLGRFRSDSSLGFGTVLATFVLFIHAIYTTQAKS